MATRIRLQDHISASSQLEALQRRARDLASATDALDALLGTALAGRCRVARLDADEVVLVTSSSAWATRLRFMAPGLCAHFARHLGRARAPRLVVRIDPPRALPLEHHRQPISPRSAALLESVAAASDDPRLGAALRRLAARQGGPERSQPD